MAGGIRSVGGVLEAGRDSRYSGARRGIGAFGAPMGVGSVGGPFWELGDSGV